MLLMFGSVYTSLEADLYLVKETSEQEQWTNQPFDYVMVTGCIVLSVIKEIVTIKSFFLHHHPLL